MHIFLSNNWWQRSVIWSQASYRYPILWETFLDPSDSYFLFADFVDFYTHWTYMLIFRRIFLSNYWWQKFDIWSQASYRYPISWEVFFDPSDSYILFAEERGYHRWALAHSSSCLLLVRTLYGMTKFLICYWSEHCTVWPSLWFVTGQYTVCYDHFSLWFVTGQNTVCYDQVYDLLLARMLYVTTKFMICYWSEHCMLRPSLWFVTG
jgi:hypothetical protein